MAVLINMRKKKIEDFFCCLFCLWNTLERKKSPCIVRIHRVIHSHLRLRSFSFRSFHAAPEINEWKKKNHARREVTDAAAAKKTTWTRPILKGWEPNVRARQNVLFVDLLKLRRLDVRCRALISSKMKSKEGFYLSG